MNPHLKRLQEQIATVVELPPEQFTVPARGKWCVAEILEHLYLTYTGTTKGFQRLAERGKPVITATTWRQRLGRLVVVQFGFLPSGREAPPTSRPRGIPPEQVRDQIVPKIAEMDQAIWGCEEKLGRNIKLLDHPILGPLSGMEWRKFHLVHGLHHIRQIQRLGGETAGSQSKI